MAIRDEELEHQAGASARRDCYRLPSRLLDRLIAAITGFMIWIATLGASTRRYV